MSLPITSLATLGGKWEVLDCRPKEKNRKIWDKNIRSMPFQEDIVSKAQDQITSLEVKITCFFPAKILIRGDSRKLTVLEFTRKQGEGVTID